MLSVTFDTIVYLEVCLHSDWWPIVRTTFSLLSCRIFDLTATLVSVSYLGTVRGERTLFYYLWVFICLYNRYGMCLKLKNVFTNWFVRTFVYSFIFFINFIHISPFFKSWLFYVDLIFYWVIYLSHCLSSSLLSQFNFSSVVFHKLNCCLCFV